MSITYLDKVEAVTEDAGIIESAATGIGEAIMDRMTVSFASGLARSLGQGVTFGFADEAEAFIRSTFGEDEYAKIRNDIRENLNQFRADEPAFAYGAEIGAALLTPGGAARLATKAGLKTLADKAVMAAAKRPTTAAGVGGAVYGAGTAEEAEDVLVGAGVSALAGMGGQAMAPTVSRTARALQRAGIPVTPGQLFGRGAAKAEQALTSVPMMGAGVSKAREKAVEAFPATMYGRALRPLGVTIPPMMQPRAAANKAAAEFRKRYDAALKGVEIDVTDDVLDELSGAVSAAKSGLGEAQEAVGRDIETMVLQKVLSGEKLTGEGLKKIQSELGRKSSGAIKANNFELAEAYDAVDTALMSVFAKNAPEKAADLRKIDEAYSMYVPLRRAAAGAPESAFTPAQAMRAVRAEERKLGATGMGRLERGEARLQRPIEAAQQVIGSVVPDSGTAGRLMAGGMLMGGGGALAGAPVGMSPEGALGMLGLGMMGRGMYTPIGQKVLRGGRPTILGRDLQVPGAIQITSGALRSPASAGLLAEQLAPSVQETLLGPTYP